MSHEVVNLATPTGLNWNEHSLGSAIDGHRRGRQRCLQLRVGEVGQALEDREVGHHRQRKAREDDRLAADLVRQPAEDDEERRAEQKRNRDQNLRRDRGHLHRQRQEEQCIELSAVPDDGFAGGGTEQRQDRDLEIRPFAEGFRQRALGALAVFLHAAGTPATHSA